MKAIQIKYIPATATRGPRLKAFTDAGSIIESINDKYIYLDQQAYDLALCYSETNFGHTNITGFGVLPNGDYVATIGSK